MRPIAPGRLSIFISYRRDDTAGFAGRLYDELGDAFGAGQLFMDVDTIRPGEDFTEKVGDAVARCDVLLALIGPSWLSATDARGERRLDSAEDLVRLEIEAALRAGKQIIPLLIQGASMPKADDLPSSLRPLAFRQALEISHTRWRADVSELRALLEKEAVALHGESANGGGPATVAPGNTIVASRTRWSTLALGAVALAIVVAAGLGVVWHGGSTGSPAPSTTVGASAGTSASGPPGSVGSPGAGASGGLQSVTLALSTALFPDVLTPAMELAVSDAATKLADAGYTIAISGQSLGAIGGTPSTAGAQAARTIAARPDVVAVVGPEENEAVAAEAPITNGAGLLQCSPAAMDPRLTKATFGADALRSANPTATNMITLLATWDEVGGAAAGYATSVLHASKALAIDDSTRSSQIFADSFATAFGPAATTRKTVTGSVSDFSALLASSHYDVVAFVPTQASQAAQLKLDMKKSMPAAPLIVGDDELFPGDPTHAGYLDTAGAAAEGTYLFSSIPETLPGLDEFSRHLAAVHPQLPAPRALEGLYVACTQVIIDVLLEHPRSSDVRGDIRAQVYCGCAFDTVAGPIAFTPEGDNTRPAITTYRATLSASAGKGDWTLVDQIQIQIEP